KKSRNNFSNKLLIETCGIFAAIFLFIIIWINSDYMMWSTHLSFILFIGCCLYYLFVQIKDYKSISNSEHLLKQPDEYISYLKHYRNKRHILNTNNYKI